MRNQIRLLALLLLLLTAFTGCQKKDEPAPDAGTEIAGTYNVTYAKVDALELANIPAGYYTLVVVRVAETQASVNLKSNLPGQQAEDESLGTFDLSRNGSTIEVLAGTTKIGTYSAGKLDIEATGEDQDGVEFYVKFNSTKQ